VERSLKRLRLERIDAYQLHAPDNVISFEVSIEALARLRAKLIQAYAAARGSLAELASQFWVSYGYTKKIRGQHLQTGGVERPRQVRRGPTGRLKAEIKQYLRAVVGRQPDVTSGGTVRAVAGRAPGRDRPITAVVLASQPGVAAQKNAARPGAGPR
jgi:hypothetical protein